MYSNIELYDYDLPEELIAQYPAENRGGSRLLVVNRKAGSIEDRAFSELPDILDERYFLVLNDTKVIPARLAVVKPTGGASEIFFLNRVSDYSFDALIKGKTKPGDLLFVNDKIQIKVESRLGDGGWLVASEIPVEELLQNYGKIPLPPYIKREPEKIDAERYQTVFAQDSGSVAAPTAGFHFTGDMLAKIAARNIEQIYVTLQVGIGTFRPIKADNLDSHVMHREQYSISNEAADRINGLKKEGKCLLAVGTTTVRTLESAAGNEYGVTAGEKSTGLFIRPGYRFRVTDALITNFHLPKSSLLVMLSAFMGMELRKKAYRHAVSERYRFFSYGDAMLIL